MDSTPPTSRKRRVGRALTFIVFFVVSAVLFVGGIAAGLYLLFSRYSGVQNIWILVCGAPALLAIVVLITVVNLYFRFGRPLENLFDTINAVEGGNLSARVAEKSDMFSDLFKRFNKMVAELERSETQRRNLTADIAHELRNPLHIIQGNLEGIIDGVYEPTPAHIKDTLDETHLLTRLVQDLQTLSLAETGQLPLHPTRFRVADLLADLYASFAPQAAAQGLSLHTHLADPGLELTADYDRLNQVFSNLIANALRYTSTGTITLRAESSAFDKILICVQDTGAGIPPSELPFIFDRFWRGDRSRTERTHSGLGLAIARQLIHAHGGSIEAQSEGVTGNGTTFVVQLPRLFQGEVKT